MPKVHVSKSIFIDAPVERVYGIVRNFRQWPTWSPWLITEPDCAVTYADDGKQYAWDGTIVGAGEMEVVGEAPNEEIVYHLRFLRPFKSKADVAMRFAKRDQGTEVTWTLMSSLPFFLFFMRPMMTALIGMDYRRGLTMLKDYVETGSVPSRLEFPGEQAVASTPYIGIRRGCSIDDIGSVMAADSQRLQAWSEGEGQQRGGNPFCIYHRWDLIKGLTEYTFAVPLASALSEAPNGFTIGERPACRAFVVKHTGPYQHLGNAWSAGMFRARNKIFRQSRTVPPFEILENQRGEVPDAQLVTTVHFPLK